MEIFLIALVVAAAAIIYYNRKSKSFDINNDGKINTADVKAAVQNVVCGAKETADVNKDGKVNVADAKVAVKKASNKVKQTVKKSTNRSRKPKSKA